MSTRVRIDDNGITAPADKELVLDVVFDGRRIWSFWLIRDGESRGPDSFVEWPPALRRFLDGTVEIGLVEHATGDVLFTGEVALGGKGAQRIKVETEDGKPLGLDKSNRLAQTFDTRSSEHVAPLLDSIEEVLDALRKAGIDAFPAYGTLLGAVRGGKLIGHDSDADIGYVSDHTKPVDVVRESFRLQRRLSEMGYEITRYSGAAFKVDVAEADGSVRGLDVFGGFLTDDEHLVLMGEIRTPFKREWIFPLGTTTLEGRELPAPADTDKFLSATYGPSWRVPDPAYHFETPESTHRRLNGWFRGTRVGRDNWDRVWSKAEREGRADLTPDALTRWAAESLDRPAQVVDIGCGNGAAVHHFAQQGVPALGLDYSPRSFAHAAALAEEQGLPARYERVNLLELRQTLAWAARIARDPGPRLVIGRHFLDTTTVAGREHFWRMAEMLTRDGGRTVVEFVVPSEGAEKVRLLRPLRAQRVRREVKERGADVLDVTEYDTDTSAVLGADAPRTGGRIRVCRMVVEWP
ncbi:class I SAM-dependent methyltransferase [Nocardioides dubius]|uniref:Methyltransferase domain-containing protein n=1 Tax=Nocardioides dubius TaxID=317019 RepID=A0ABN1TS43_9ACTN